MSSGDHSTITTEELLDMSSEEMRWHVANGKSLPKLSEEQLKQLPGDVVEPYIVARFNQTGDRGWFEKTRHSLKAGLRADQVTSERIAERQSSGIDYLEGPPRSDRNYLADRHEKLKSDVNAVRPEGIKAYSDTYYNVSQVLRKVSDLLREKVGKSQQEWEGDAADSAHGYFLGLGDWAEGNAENAMLASDMIVKESEAAESARNSMPEPVPFDMKSEITGWVSDPLSFDDRISETIDKHRRSQEAHEEAARVMTRYDSDLNEAGSKQPVFTEPPSFDGSSSAGDTGSGVMSISGTGTTASGVAGGAPGGATGAVPGGVAGGGPAGSPGSLPGGASSGVAPTPGTTSPSGWQPGPGVPGGRNGGNPGTGVGPMPVGGPVGAGGGFGPGGAGGGGYGAGGSGGYGGGRAGGFGPGGGAGGAAGPGAGASTGARPGAMPPGGAAAAGGPAASAAGRAGTGGAPMGAGAGRGGQGSEDEEHQRPSYLVEADPDSIFGTEERTAPPVIGE